MKVKVEMVLRGVEPRRTIDIYEAFPTGGLSGDRLYLFPAPLDDPSNYPREEAEAQVVWHGVSCPGSRC
jgi:hypothetical protein